MNTCYLLPMQHSINLSAPFQGTPPVIADRAKD